MRSGSGYVALNVLSRMVGSLEYLSSIISISFEDWLHVWKELCFLNGLDSGYHYLKCCMH